MVGDVAQVMQDMRVDSTSGELQVKVYWRVGIAVSTVSGWIKVTDTEESEVTPCGAPGS